MELTWHGDAFQSWVTRDSPQKAVFFFRYRFAHNTQYCSAELPAGEVEIIEKIDLCGLRARAAQWSAARGVVRARVSTLTRGVAGAEC